MTESSGTAIAVRDNIEALWQPGWEATKVGIKFETEMDSEGNIKLVDPGKEKLARLAKGLKAGNVVWGWYVGDTACLYKALYGDEAVDKFFEDIGYTDDQKSYGKKLMTTSKAFGFPDKIEEQRVDGLTHAHHQVVQGMEEPQRNKELKRALKLGLNKEELRQRKLELEGKTQEGDKKEEYPVFHCKFAAFDPAKDNPEQYLAMCHQQLDEEFAYYRDPAKKEERELQVTKEKAVDGLPDELKAKVLEQGAALDGTAFKALAKKVKDANKVFEQVQKLFTKKVSDEAKREEMIAGAKESGMSTEAAKEALKAYKKELDEKGKAEKTIEQLVAKLKNEETRKSLLEQAATENLTKEQFEPLVQTAIQKEMYDEELAKLNDPEYQKKLAEKAAAKLAPPKPRKAGGKKADGSANQPLSKGGGKKSGKKKG